MRFKDKITIALQNLKAGKQMVRKMIFGMLFVVMIVFSVMTIMQSYFSYIENFNKKHTTDCYYYTEFKNQPITDNEINKLLKESANQKNKYNADEASVLCTITYNNNNNAEIEAGSTNLVINNVNYQGVNYFHSNRQVYQSIQSKESPVSLALYQKDFSVFSNTITTAYGKEYLIGKYPENSGEIMLDAYILDVYGVKDIDERLLGSTISITYTNKATKEIVLQNYKLSGIFKGDLLTQRESLMTNDNHLEHIYVNLRKEDYNKFNIYYGSVRYYFKDYIEYVNNYEYSKDILKLNVSKIFDSENNPLKITGLGMEYCLLYWVMNNIGKLLLLIAVAIGIIITFSVFYIFQFYRDRNARYLSMLRCIGMEKRDRTHIFTMEICSMMAIATVLGVYLSAIFLLLMNFVTKQALNFPMVFDIKIAIIAIIASWLYLTICMRIAMRKNS